MRWSFIQKESPCFKPTIYNSGRAIPRRNKNALKSSSSLYKLDSYLSVASYKVNVFKIRLLEEIIQKELLRGKKKGEDFLVSHRVTEQQIKRQWQWGSHFSWVSVTQDKKERGGYKPGWVVSNPEPLSHWPHWQLVTENTSLKKARHILCLEIYKHSCQEALSKLHLHFSGPFPK